jgi:hypothetical protein
LACSSVICGGSGGFVSFVILACRHAAHNISESKHRATIMGSPSADFAEARFVVRCLRCRETTRAVIRGLLRYLDGQMSVVHLVDRLRCGMPRCGTRPPRCRSLARLARSSLSARGVRMIEIRLKRRYRVLISRRGIKRTRALTAAAPLNYRHQRSAKRVVNADSGPSGMGVSFELMELRQTSKHLLRRVVGSVPIGRRL